MDWRRFGVGTIARVTVAGAAATLERIRRRDTFCNKPGYLARTTPAYVDDILAESEVKSHQPDVYRFAAYLANRLECKHAVAVGCGSGTELFEMFPQSQVVGVDFGANLQRSRRQYPGGTWIEHDLDRAGRVRIAETVLRRSVIICADVIEHLVNPACLLSNLRAWLDYAPVCLLSTPERDLVRGENDFGPPANPAHVREWTLGELETLLRRSRLNVEFIGLTVNNARDRKKKTILAVLGPNRTSAASAGAAVPPDFRVVAIMSAYNEADIVLPSIRQLAGQGVEVYLVDNWSTDGTYELAQRLPAGMLGGIERFPEKGPTQFYEWSALLARVEEIGREVRADWFIHHDVDEVRLSPWPGVSLRQGIYAVDVAGFNAIDHTVLLHPAVDDSFTPGTDFQQHFRWFEFAERHGPSVQIKAWKNLGQRIALAASGGHEAWFHGRRVYPYKFLLKHYPIRSQSHGEKKVFAERQARWHPEERARGWHVQYDKFRPGDRFVRDRQELELFDEATFDKVYLVERLSEVGILPPG
jgi:hypothetical protein